MKNNIIKLIVVFGLLSMFTACNDDDETSFALNNISAPSNLSALIEMTDPDTNEISVTLSGENASTFDVFFGDVENEDATIANPGETLVKQYPEEGTYILRAIAKNINGATSELSRSIIIEPVEPMEPIELDILVFPIDHESSTLAYEWGAFGGASSAAVIENPDATGVNVSSTVLVINKAEGAPVWAGTALLLDEAIDFSNSTIVSLKVWSPRTGVPILFKIEDADSELNADNIPGVFAEQAVETTVANSWEILVYNLSTIEAFDASQLYDNIVIFPDFGSEGLGEDFYFDDIEFSSKAPTPISIGENLAINGDFESENETWTVGAGDEASLVTTLTTENANTFYSVNVTEAGNVFDVNMSQEVEIIQGNTYTLTFDAWSNVDRTILAGVGLSVGPFTNTSQEVSLTTSVTTYTLSLSAQEFGATNARILFDNGGEVGIVNIDNVSLIVN